MEIDDLEAGEHLITLRVYDSAATWGLEKFCCLPARQGNSGRQFILSKLSYRQATLYKNTPMALPGGFPVDFFAVNCDSHATPGNISRI